MTTKKKVLKKKKIKDSDDTSNVNYPCPKDTIKMGGFDFEIKYMDRPEMDSTESLGGFSSTHCHIKFPGVLNRFQLGDTALHEIHHMISYVMALDRTSSQDDPDLKNLGEEDYADIMSSGWGMVFRDNPLVVLWMLYLYTNDPRILKLMTDMKKTGEHYVTKGGK